MNPTRYSPFLSFGDFADIYLEDSQNLTLRWEDGEVQDISHSLFGGAGIRFLNGPETRFGHVDLPHPLDELSDDGKKRLTQVCRQVSAGLPALDDKPFPDTLPSAEHLIKKKPSEIPLSEKIGLLRTADEAARATSSSLRQITIHYGEKVKRVGYLNSDGEGYLETRAYVVFNLRVTAEKNGDIQTAYESMGGLVGWELFDGRRVEEAARLAAERAIKKLSAPNAPVGEMPVVIAARAGGTLIHEAVGHSLEADAVLEGTSPAYLGKLGKTVANKKLTVYDDPTVTGARGSFHYDDEGVHSEASKLIDKGVLRDYMYDRQSARKAGRASNGHGRRESYAHPPIPRMSNTFVAPGHDDPSKIIRSLKNGLLVTRMGGGQVNTANGDFVFEVEEGFHVKNGRATLVRGATLLGNGPEVLKRIDQVGSDHGWSIGTCGKEGQGVPVSDAIPTIRIKKLVVGGVKV